MRLYCFTLLILLSFLSISQTKDEIHLPMIAPLHLTSNYAEYRKNSFHHGLDIRTFDKATKNVFSSWDGYLSRVRFNSVSYGRAVYITHPNGYTSVYGHLDSFCPQIDSIVKEYQYANKVFETDIYLPKGKLNIKKGDVIGVAGNSGYSFGEHLHFEIRDTQTQTTQNPLSFIALEDNKKPVFYQLAVYTLQSGGFLPASAKYYKTFKSGKIYTTANEIIVPDTFFLGFDVQDFQAIPSYKLLPQFIEVFIDDILVWKIHFDSYPFTLSTACRGVFDNVAGLNSNKQITTTYSGKNVGLNFYKKISNNGLFVLGDNNKHKLTIKATDSEFNTSIFATTIIRDIKPSFNSAGKYKIYTHQNNTFSTNEIAINLPIGAFYGDIALQTSFLTESKDGENFIWTVGNNDLPLIKQLTVNFKNKNLISANTLLALLSDKNKIIRVWKPVLNSNNIWSAKIDRLGNISLVVDTIAPEISKTNIPISNKITYQKQIILIVTDNYGIKEYSAFINGKWTLMIYDLKSDMFTIPISNDQKTDLKELRVEFIDIVGNKMEKTYNF